MDARKLRRYESIMTQASAVLAITASDAAHFQAIGCQRVLLVSASHPMDEVVSQVGQGRYALFHGDLSVAENIDAVRFLADKVFKESPYRLIVAGRNPSHLLSRCKEIDIEPNPSEERMEQLIREAQVNILFTQQATGLKLKLLHSLYSGRHCLVNGLMVAGTSLAPACHVADDAQSMRETLDALMTTPFTESDIQTRKSLLISLYGNAVNAEVIVNLISSNI